MRRLAASRLLIMVVLLAFTVMMVGGVSWAAPVPSQTTVSTTDKPSADTAKAERALVQGTLAAYGLTQSEAQARVNLLTDAEVHALAGNLDAIQTAGARGSWSTTEVLLIAILVVLIVS